MPAISIVIPTRDRIAELQACLQGLAAQDAPHLLAEVIVIDDHPLEPCAEIIRPLARRLHLPLVYDENRQVRGSAGARNHAAGLARGDWLGFLDDDAVPAPDWLRVAAKHMLTPSTAAVTGRILASDGRRLYSRARQLRYELRQQHALSVSVPVQALAGGNSVVTREAFEAVGGFDPRFEMMHDRELALRMSANGQYCRYAHDLVIAHRNHKSIALAYLNSFHSAYFRLQLESLYPHISRITVRGQLEMFQTLIASARSRRDLVAPGLIACSTELAHSLGYLWFRYADQRPRFARPVAATCVPGDGRVQEREQPPLSRHAPGEGTSPV